MDDILHLIPYEYCPCCGVLGPQDCGCRDGTRLDCPECGKCTDHCECPPRSEDTDEEPARD